MRHTMRSMNGEPVLALDGRIGALDDLYFDERRFAVRYFVVDADDWLPGQRLLVAPEALAGQMAEGEEAVEEPMRVSLTRAELLLGPRGTDDPEVPRLLHSGADLIGYSVETRGACIGQVVDVVLDPECTTVEGLMVDTSDGRPSLLRLRPARIQGIDAGQRRILIHE